MSEGQTPNPSRIDFPATDNRQLVAQTRPPRPSILIPLLAVSSVALVSAIVLPYALVRKRLALLHDQVAKAATADALMRRDIHNLVTENTLMRGELAKTLGERGAGLQDIRKQLQLLEEHHRAGLEGVEDIKEQVRQGEVTRLEMNERLHEAMKTLLQAVQRAEVDAVKRDQAGVEWRRNLLNHFTIPGWTKK